MTTSVALCTYNGEKYLREQLDSILAQDSPVDEIVICDDGSTDGTASILKDYETKFSNIFRIYFNSENLGYVRNFEKAMKLCTKDLIFLCDQDDIWYTDKVSDTINFFKAHSEIGIVAHDIDLIGSYEGKKTFWELQGFEATQKNYSQTQLLQHLLIDGNVFPGMSLTIRIELLKQYLPLQKVDSIIIHDYEIIIKSLRDGQFGLLKKTLGGYRQHESQSIGYNDFQPGEKNTIKEIHLLSQNYIRITNYIILFNLTDNIAVNFQNIMKEKYSKFLKQYSLIERLFLHLKYKYYYKIIHF